MCIFARPVIAVNNTQIFARLTGNGTQFLAYQMNYDSRETNAMILPVPVALPSSDESLKFISLENYTGFFSDLDNLFPFHHTFSIGCSASPDIATSSMLHVFKVGNYIASFVPSLSDFDRLDERFKLPSETWNKIPGYKDFGFAVFQLAAGSLRPHPMAFEFKTANSELFFPTVHIHDGQIHDSEDFDHVLYMQHAGLDSKVYGYENADIQDEATALIRSKFRASQFCDIEKSAGLLDGNLLVHRKLIRGQSANIDTVIATTGDPLKPTFNIRPYFSYAPWLLALAAIGWFFSRRSSLRTARENQIKNSPDKDDFINKS